MKEFVIYTALRIGLFIGCYAVFLAIWLLIAGAENGKGFLWPFIAAVVVSSVLSFKLLRGPRARFAQRVEARATKATEAMQAMRAREDED